MKKLSLEELEEQSLQDQQNELESLIKYEEPFDISKIDPADLKFWQAKIESADSIGEYKRIGREFRDLYKLSDRQALDLLRGRT